MHAMCVTHYVTIHSVHRSICIFFTLQPRYWAGLFAGVDQLFAVLQHDYKIPLSDVGLLLVGGRLVCRRSRFKHGSFIDGPVAKALHHARASVCAAVGFERQPRESRSEVQISLALSRPKETVTVPTKIHFIQSYHPKTCHLIVLSSSAVNRDCT